MHAPRSPDVPLYASAVHDSLAAVWHSSPAGGIILARDDQGRALTAATVEAAQHLLPESVTPQALDARGRMFLRAALALDLSEHSDRVHVSPVYGSRLPQAFAWMGAEESPMPRVLRRQGAVRLWNGSSSEDACRRALAELHGEYPDAVLSPCPSGAYGLATHLQREAARARQAAPHA